MSKLQIQSVAVAVLSAAILLSGCSSVYAQDDDELFSQKREIGSWFDALYANSLGIEKGDVLLVQRRSFNYSHPSSDLAYLEETKIYHRLVFDSLKNKHLYVRRNVVRQTIIPSADAKPIEKNDEKLSGFLIANGKTRFRYFPKSIVTSNQELIEPMYTQFAIPSLRSVGLLTFGGHRNQGKIKQAADRLSSAEEITSIKKRLDNMIVEYSFKSNSGKSTSLVKVKFDSTDQMPVSRQIFSISSKENKHKLSEEFFTWGDLNGVKVPIKVRKKNTDSRTIGESKVYAIQPTETEIHWFSLNSDLPNELFSESNLDQSETMIDLVDPVKTNAYSLLDDHADESQKTDTSKLKNK